MKALRKVKQQWKECRGLDSASCGGKGQDAGQGAWEYTCTKHDPRSSDRARRDAVFLYCDQRLGFRKLVSRRSRYEYLQALCVTSDIFPRLDDLPSCLLDCAYIVEHVIRRTCSSTPVPIGLKLVTCLSPEADQR